MFQKAGINLDKPMVAMCGSGMSACWIIAAGLLCGVKTVPLYDVSITCCAPPRSMLLAAIVTVYNQLVCNAYHWLVEWSLLMWALYNKDTCIIHTLSYGPKVLL